MAVVGTVLRFDAVKGYGFVAPDNGAEDVFIHVNDMLFDKRAVVSGSKVEFVLEEGEKGPKASRIKLLDPPRPASDVAVGPAAGVADAAAAAGAAGHPDDDLCDTLSSKEYLGEVTESLLGCASITAAQIGDIRQRMLQIAQSHGWIDDGERA